MRYKNMLLLLMLVAFTTASCQDTEKAGFYKGSVDTTMPIESKYKEKGSEEVAKTEYDSDDATIGKIVVVYPHSLLKSDEALPLVNIGNASNTTAYDLIEAMEHLASWGFVVIGNMDKQTGTGASMSHRSDGTFGIMGLCCDRQYGQADGHRSFYVAYVGCIPHPCSPAGQSVLWQDRYDKDCHCRIFPRRIRSSYGSYGLSQ